MADDQPDPDRDDDAPLGDLAERLRARRRGGEAGDRRSTDPDGAGWGLDQYFESEPFDDLAADDLWETLGEGPTAGDEIEPGEGPNEHVVPKRSYCESCEYLGEPPAVRCEHPGTAIVEFVDIDHVLVRNCPVVAERRATGEEDHGAVTPGNFGKQ